MVGTYDEGKEDASLQRGWLKESQGDFLRAGIFLANNFLPLKPLFGVDVLVMQLAL
jgi:hypothetical protein